MYNKFLLITVLTGLLMIGLFAGISYPSQATLLKVNVEVSQTTMIWQTKPPAFQEITRWAGVSLVVLLEPVTLSTGITVVDFQTMQPEYPPDFYIGASVRIAQLGITRAHIGGGAVITPAHNWIGWYLGVGQTTSFTRTIEADGDIGVETTRGASRYPPGTCIYLSVGVHWTWHLL